MNCDRVRDLILTDYIDQEIGADWKSQIDQHMDTCPDCREYAKIVAKTVVEPFLKAEVLPVPESSWQDIHQQIIHEQILKPKESILQNLLSLGQRILSPQAVGFSLALVMIVLVGAIARQGAQNPSISQAVGDDNGLAYSVADLPGNDNKGFGTAMEQYFL